ncbi:MAG: Crp/Fnr family transcriptional regulator [Acidobacteria bacterium]|nr:Crp/Fnr family transcriptional regulator [Acidobacteriota bacterium]
MASAARERLFGAKSALFREGEDVKSVFLIASGWVKTSQLSRSGKEVILRVDGRGEVIDGIGAGYLAVHAFTAETMDDCYLLTWDAKTYLSFVKRFPSLQINASRVLAERLHKLEARFRDLAAEPVKQRLARLLLSLYEQSVGATHDLHIALSCEELAQMTGTTLFTVSRLLSDWQEQEIICRERRTVVVENPAMLSAIAEGC